MSRNILIPIIFIIGIILTLVLSKKYFLIEKNLENLEIKNCSKLKRKPLLASKKFFIHKNGNKI